MRPATRSALDIAFWLLERGMIEGWPLPPKRLRAMMYLAQARFAEREARKLMPATFLVTRQGPLEPTVTLVLVSGLKRPWAPLLPPAAATFMEDFWERYGRLATSDMQKEVSRHPAWVDAWALGPGTEVQLLGIARAAAQPTMRPQAENLPEDPLAAGGGPRPAGQPDMTAGAEPAHFDDPEMERARVRQDSMEPQALQLKEDEVRFTLDGRRITKWRPRRRIN
ncbi:MAG: hypothetical protein RIB84_08355 [Sneathiellaceae bacterium]